VYILKRDTDHVLELKSDLFLAKQLTQEGRTKYLEVMLKIAKNLSGSGCADGFSGVNIGVGFVSSDCGRKIKQRFRLVDNYKPMTLPLKLANWGICVLMLLIFSASFLFVVQPSVERPPDFQESDMFELNLDDAGTYLTNNNNGSYSLYSNGTYICDVFDVKPEPFSRLPIR